MAEAEVVFGRAVREARDAFDWAQETVRRHLSDRFGIDIGKTAMSRLETGQRPTTLNEAFALSELLGIDLSALKVDYDRVEIRIADDQLTDAKAEVDRLTARLARLKAVS